MENNIFLKVSGFLILLQIFQYITACSDYRDRFSGDNMGCTASECHVSTELGSYPPESGKHTLHLARDNINCDSCHSRYLEKGIHKNGKLDGNLNRGESADSGVIVSFNRSSGYGEWDVNSGTCRNIGCHIGSNLAKKSQRIRGAVTVRDTPAVGWYTGFSGLCTICHAPGVYIDPLATNGEGTLGKHIVHVTDAGIACINCHNNYTDSRSHFNGTYGTNETVDIVAFGDSYNGAFVSADFDDSTGDCDNISCHGNTGGVNWYASSTGCTACHAPGSLQDPLTTSGEGTDGKHIAHVINRGIDCEVCHLDYKESPNHMNSIYGKLEIDSIIQFGGTYPGSGGTAVTAAFNDDTGGCDAISCHGYTGNVNWYSLGTGCTACHSPGSSIDPLITNGTGASGKHLPHVQDQGFACTKCHSGYNTQPTHMNGIFDTTNPLVNIISFDSTNSSASWDDPATSCGGMVCHGTADWYTTEQLGCTVCHAPGTSIDPLTVNGSGTDGKHIKHYTDNGIGCQQCHYDYYNNPLHKNGILNGKSDPANIVFFNFPCGTNTFNPGVIEQTCQVEYCHGGGIMEWYGTGGVSCIDCHSGPVGCAPDQRRQIVEAGGDFSGTTHHLNGNSIPGYWSDGTTVAADCRVCHDTSQHTGKIVRLKDADTGSVYTYEKGVTPDSELAPFCLSCHDGNSAGGSEPFTDGAVPPDVKGSAGNLWSDSAHKNLGYSQNGGNPVSCFGDGTSTGCHNSHGSGNIKLLAGGNFGGNLESFCFRCHTEGKIINHALSDNRPGAYVSADDIEQAFGKTRKHDLGSVFSVNGNDFTLQCSTCHNPHVVTGKYWDAEAGLSPITRPDFSSSSGNPRAVGTQLWGDNTGEKMDDFAATGSGTGGFYYNIARGYTLGDTNLPFDQPAKYQPPKSGSGYSYEFGGDVLPDYTTFCLDCHSNRMSDSAGAINWGQGISCGYPEPPGTNWSNWVRCGSPHGLGAANMSSYISDSGTTGFWGTSGNPDVLFLMNYVTRGRHNGHFMRWPYDSADRGAGINFVMSCTDCHEAHGSDRGGMVRERLNVTQNGDCGTGGNTSPDGENCADGSNWNQFCNVCHYYYGGQHAGMSCGSASCHETNSIHRIKKGGGSGPTQLMLTSSGYEGDFIRPDFTPDILTAEGMTGSSQLMVTFRTEVYGDSALTGSLGPDDFWLFDVNGNNPRSITAVSHIAGESTATITMSAPLTESDLNSDLLALKPASAWIWYTGGYVNWDSGEIPPRAVSGGPWPVKISGKVNITSVEGTIGLDKLLVTFSHGVFSNSDGTGSLEISDFIITDSDNGRSITSVEHYAGQANAVLTLSSPLDGTGDIGIDTIAGASASIYDVEGYSLDGNQVQVMGTNCPVGGTTFNFDETAGSSSVWDITGFVIGDAGNPLFSFPGDGFYYGDVNEPTMTFVDFNTNDTCFKIANNLTIEARIKPALVDSDGTTIGSPYVNTFNRVFERKRSIKVTLLNTDYRGDNIPGRQDKASIEVKYFVDTASRHTCPDPRWPADPYTGNDAQWHQISTDIDQWPIVNDHWYRIKVVFNTNKAFIAGSDGTPVDIFVDDQGTAGDDAGELWAGYINASQSINDSSTCQWGALPGDYIAREDQPFFIGSAPSTAYNQRFTGAMDWVKWKPVADYSGVDDLPK